MVVPASIQAAQPKDDNTSPYFESAAVRDSFKNCKKPIWTNNWDDLPADKHQDHFVEFNNDPKYYNMTFRELRNRRALTGESCTINKLIGVVGVGSWAKDMAASYRRFTRQLCTGELRGTSRGNRRPDSKCKRYG